MCRLCLANLFETRWDEEEEDQVSCHLELVPDKPVPEPPEEPEPTRVRKVTIVHYDGRWALSVSQIGFWAAGVGLSSCVVHRERAVPAFQLATWHQLGIARRLT